MEERFLELMEIILKDILKLTRYKYYKELHKKHYGPIESGDFYYRHVIEPIEKREEGNNNPLSVETIDKIDETLFFFCREKCFSEGRVRNGFKKLKKNSFININPLEDKVRFNKIAVAKVLVHLWHYYYAGLCENKKNLPACNIDAYLQELAQGNLIATLQVEDFRKAQKSVDKIRVSDMQKNPEIVNLVYGIFVEKFIETDMTDLLEEEYNAFIDVVYYLSDIFDYTNDERSYNLQAIALNSLSNYYNDNFKDIDRENLRRLTGLIYGIAIAIKNDNVKSKYYLTLTENGNIITTTDEEYEDKQKKPTDKLDFCIAAMRTVSKAKYFKRTKLSFDQRVVVLEKKQNDFATKRVTNKTFDDELLSEFELAALWASDTAAVHKIYNEKSGNKIDYHLRMAKKLHTYCGNTRKLLIDVYQAKSKSKKDGYYEKAELLKGRYAKTLSNLAGIKEVEEEFLEGILDRSVLHTRFGFLGLETLAQIEEKNLKIAIKNFKKMKANEYSFDVDYDILMLPLYTEKEFREDLGLSGTKARTMVKARETFLKDCGSRFKKSAFNKYLEAANVVFPPSKIYCFEEELKKMFEYLIDSRDTLKLPYISVNDCVNEKDTLSNVLKKELITYYLPEVKKSRSKKATK